MQSCLHPVAEVEKLFPAFDYISGETFQVARCRECAQVVTLPVPADIGRYYPAGYYGDKQGRRFPAVMEWLQEKLYAWRSGQVLRRLKRKNARVLDIGCGRGLLLRAFQQNGCDVTGTEFSEGACRFAREVLKLPVRVGLLEQINFPDNSFDVVVMWHVLEHVSDPRPTLAEVARILRPGGIFLVAVPNFGSAEARLTKAGWFHLDCPRHLSHHTRESLSRILDEAGLSPKWISALAPEYDNFSFVQSLLNWLGVRPNLLYNWLRGQSAKVIGRKKSYGSAIATVLLTPVLGVISVPATLLLALLGRGATLTITAVKNLRRRNCLERGRGICSARHMTLEEIRGKIKDCAARMNAAYGATVFDEWSVVSLELERARILYYTGPRNDEFLKNFVADLGTLRTALLDEKFGAGDFEFSRHAVGTRHEAFLVLGKDLFLICNNTRESMETIAKNPRWLKAQVPFVEFAEAVHANPLGDSADTKIFIKP